MSMDAVFAENGALSRAMSAYRPRPGQIEMAQAVEQSLSGGAVVLEAGAGIGKTFAYLAPLIANGASALISTGTRALQDQLQRDIPLMAAALGRSAEVAVLKGRGNYLCKLGISEAHESGLFPDEEGGEWRRLSQFAARTQDGDIANADIPAASPVWRSAVSTRESCPTQQCQHYAEDCFVYRARARARRANIVIVNHHLFLSDMRLKDDGVAEILPSRDVLLFDEAHLLPQLASQCFGERLPTTRLERIAADGERVAKRHCRDPAPVAGAAAELRRAAGLLAEAGRRGDARLPVAAALRLAGFSQALAALEEALAAFAAALMVRAQAAPRVENLAARAADDKRILAAWRADPVVFAADDATDVADVAATVADDGDDGDIRWLEREDNGVALCLAPLSGRAVFAKLWEKTKTAIFTSATLSIGGDFRDFCESVGLGEGAETRSWDSPYDFAARALLYSPPRLPDANDPAHPKSVVAAALPLIRANDGRAFVLFSSLRALSMGAELLRADLAADGFQIFQQGDMPNDELLRRFRSANRGVLAGSQSFWQGVDVKGDALSLVVVDKIPFTPPTDPMMAARDHWRKQRGEDPFMRNQLPAAAMLMKQVAGRLMRDYDDYGVFMVGDSRLWRRGYGKTILSSLPPMRRCEDGAEAAEFLRRRGKAA